MTDNLLKTALREAASREFAGMPQSDDDITYTFSPRFTRRMNRLAKAEKNWLWRMTSTASKRAAAAGIAMILIALTACSIPAIREPVAAFFKGTYENCVRFFTGNAGADRIAERYGQAENAVPRHRQNERGQRRDPHDRRGASGVCRLSEPCPPNGGHGAAAHLLPRTYRCCGLPQKNQSDLTQTARKPRAVFCIYSSAICI